MSVPLLLGEVPDLFEGFLRGVALPVQSVLHKVPISLKQYMLNMS